VITVNFFPAGWVIMKMEIFRRLLRGERGATATEYAVAITLILLVVLASVVFLGQQVDGIFTDFGSLVAPYMK
jgi:Flp pilus assembly pilin Flp